MNAPKIRKFYLSVVIPCVLTGIFLYLCSFLWLNRGISVSFVSDTHKNVSYQVFYTEKEADSFNEKQSVKQQAPAGKQVININLPIQQLKRLRFDIGTRPGEVIISDLKILASKTEKLNYDEFKRQNQIDFYQAKNNELHLRSEQNDPYIVYGRILNLTAGYRIDWCIFIILFCGFLFLFSKGIGYLTKFKIFENHSRIDIVFLAIFFGSLFIPMLNISDADKSDQENRMLAKKPQLMQNGVINNNFGTKFNDWFGDHFWGRNYVIPMYNSFQFSLGLLSETPTALIGKNNWLYTKHYHSENMYKNANLFTDDELKKIGENIQKFIADAKGIGVKDVYFMLSNDKESLYSENYPSGVKKANNTSRLNQLLTFFQSNYPDIHMLNFYKELSSLKNDTLLFCKAGTHMTSIGSFYEYKFLMGAIKQKYTNLTILDIEQDTKRTDGDCDTGIYQAIQWKSYPEKYLKDSLVQLKKINFSVIKQNSLIPKIQHTETIYQNQNSKNKIKVLIIGDSFTSGYINLLAESFAYVHRLYSGGSVGDFMYLPDEISEIYKSKPDIIIIEITERFLQRFLTLEFPKKN